MKILLDESIPRQLKSVFPHSFLPYTVQQMSWAGTLNGELLNLAYKHEFRALITLDQGFEFQQNTSKLLIPVFILHAKPATVKALSPLIPRVISLLESGTECNKIYHVTD